MGNVSSWDGISRVWKLSQKGGSMREGGLDSLSLRLQTSSSETNVAAFWAWAWLRALLSLSMLWGRRKRLKKCQFSQDSLAPWSLDAT